MPVADKFTTLGAGNGFPECFGESLKYDVTDLSVELNPWTYWTTFSGYNANSVGDVTQAQIDESQRLAMLFYWNAYKLKYTTVNTAAGTGGNYSVTTDDGAENAGEPVKPDDRVCFNSDDFTRDEGLDKATAYFHLSSIIKLYNGVVTDEDNFIGYALDTWLSTDSQYEIGATDDLNVINLMGISDWALGEFGDGDEFDSVGYASILIGDNGDELKVICGVNSSGGGSSNPSAMLVQTVFSDTYSIQLTSFDVYTYPTS